MYRVARRFNSIKPYINKVTPTKEHPLVTNLCKQIHNTFLLSRKSTIAFDGQKFIPSESLAEKLDNIATESLGNTANLDFNTLRKLLYLLSKFCCNDSILLSCVWQSLHKKLLLGEEIKPINEVRPKSVRHVDLMRRVKQKTIWIPMGRECLILPFCASLTHKTFYDEKCLGLINKFIKSTIRSRLYPTLEDTTLACYGYSTLYNHYQSSELGYMAKLIHMFKEWRFSEASTNDIDYFNLEFAKVYPNLEHASTSFRLNH
ncbi:hypothetical protein BMR1_03g01260 [Babesia microti strain RI]|uniref:Uncharacterized protein n=1 Tax=Babesia microti (strain RI) TaxID=1133968 RepID=A0A0K3ATG4_BABMR|nr:hypothetical protein BMR1_03g01260 [Babesia microti strain RI]CTQ40851.1 hypothetical protein BMR1_03g01260 [Babesia microti strain RI]|eukprot:XP_012648862.1 hypothetical protein BMR1_03g01260 [Babesia microti strain RI]